MIRCGSGSEFGKVSVPVTVPVPVSDTEKISRVFQNKNWYKSCLFNVIISRKVASKFRIFDFYIPFYVGSGSKSGSGTLIHSGSGSTKATVPAVPVLQHFLLVQTCKLFMELGSPS